MTTKSNTFSTNKPPDLVSIKIPASTRDTIKKRSKEQGSTYGDVVAQQFATDPPTKIGPLSRGSGKQQGTIYISSATGNIYKSPKITVDRIREMLKSPYIASKLAKRTIAYFPERVEIEVTDP